MQYKYLKYSFALALLSLPAFAKAANIVQVFSFSVSNFIGSGSPPISGINGLLQIEYDNEFSLTDRTTGIQVIFLDFPLDSQIALSYNAAASGFEIGGISGIGTFPGTNSFTGSERDFYLGFDLNAGPPHFTFATYTLGGAQSFSSVSGSVSIVGSSAVPEPASWAMVLAGFGLMGAALRSRMRQLVCLRCTGT